MNTTLDCHGENDMGKFIDLTGQKFGRLLVIERCGTAKNGGVVWKCKCDCGNISTVASCSLRRGAVVSCGCYSREKFSERLIKHGESKTRIYRCWNGIMQRCFHPKCKAYQWYGARGITVCDEWKRFEPFKEWGLANGYADNLTIDRIDVNKGYSPENCRWVTMKIQANNRRTNHFIQYRGKPYTISQLSSISGINETTICERIKRGWDAQRLLTPVADLREILELEEGVRLTP